MWTSVRFVHKSVIYIRINVYQKCYAYNRVHKKNVKNVKKEKKKLLRYEEVRRKNKNNTLVAHSIFFNIYL